MGTPISFAKGKSINKKTKEVQGALRRGPVGACCGEESFLEKSYPKGVDLWGSQATALVGRGPPRVLYFPAGENGQHPVTPGNNVLIWAPPRMVLKLLSVQHFADLKQSSLGTPRMASHITPLWAGGETKALGGQFGFSARFRHQPACEMGILSQRCSVLWT